MNINENLKLKWFITLILSMLFSMLAVFVWLIASGVAEKKLLIAGSFLVAGMVGIPSLVGQSLIIRILVGIPISLIISIFLAMLAYAQIGEHLISELMDGVFFILIVGVFFVIAGVLVQSMIVTLVFFLEKACLEVLSKNSDR